MSNPTGTALEAEARSKLMLAGWHRLTYKGVETWQHPSKPFMSCNLGAALDVLEHRGVDAYGEMK